MISNINQRRMNNFAQNKRALFSFYILAFTFLITLFAEFIANDKPIILSYKNQLYFPVVQNYAETTFGGEFETEADYKDPYIAEKIQANGWMIWPLIKYNHHSISRNMDTPAPSPPNAHNWLGTDDQGRDILARTIYGFRISMLFAIALTTVSLIAGIALGALQGFYGGKTDILMQRFMEIWDGLPFLYMLIILASIVKPDFWWLLFLLALFSWMGIAGLVRAEFLRARNFDYVRAARALGASDSVIMFRHILPNAIVSTLTFTPFIFCGAITTLVSLDYLGFGLPPGSASLGELIAQGKANLHAEWIAFTGFFVLAGTLALSMFVGEGVRDALDPRKTNS